MILNSIQSMKAINAMKFRQCSAISTMDGYKIKEHDFFELSPNHELLVLNDRVD